MSDNVYLPYNIILYNSKLDQLAIDDLKKYKIDPIDRINKINKDIIIKICEEIDINETELIIKYLSGEFESPAFLEYKAIIEITKVSKSTSYMLENINKLTTYKNTISPSIQNINTNNDNTIKLKSNNTYGIIMPKYQTLSNYLNDNELDLKCLVENIINIMDLAILIRDKYKIFHADLKIDNIVVNNDKFYLIDWELIFKEDEKYYTWQRPNNGNTEMYPYYDCTAEQFFIHSIGVLLLRIYGWNYEVTYKDFIQHYSLNYILTKFPQDSDIYNIECILIDIFNRKYTKIEELKTNISNIIKNIKKYKYG